MKEGRVVLVVLKDGRAVRAVTTSECVLGRFCGLVEESSGAPIPESDVARITYQLVE